MTMTKVFSQGEMELDCFIEALYPINTRLLAEAEERFPLNMIKPSCSQINDKQLLKRVTNSINNHDNLLYTYKEVEGVDLIHENNNILVPSATIYHTLYWYHQILVHPGHHQMFKTMNNNFTWPVMQKYIEDYCKTCHECQICKKTKKIRSMV